MANGNAPAGLKVVRLRNGSPWMGPLRGYFVPASDANNMFIGDPVVLAGTSDSTGIPAVQLATAGAGNRITGIICGLRPSGVGSQEPKYRVGSQAAYVYVCDDPNALFEVQDTAGTLVAADTHLNCDLQAGAGSTFTGSSGWVLNSGTKGTGATLQVRLVQLQHRVDNDFGAYAKWLVAINQPTETGAAGALGV